MVTRPFFDFHGFSGSATRDIDPNPLLRFVKNLGRNVKATGGWFLLGVLLSALFQRYVPAELVADLFGNNRGFGVLLAATIGVPLYACGGGTIPLLQAWLANGMSMGSATAFMITGPATKITNLGAVKIVLGVRRFALYLVYANENPHLLQEILRDEWGFDGFVVSDWGASNDHTAGVAVGSHLEMPTTGGDSDLELVEAVKSGRLDEKLLDQRVDELLDQVFIISGEGQQPQRGQQFGLPVKLFQRGQ